MEAVAFEPSQWLPSAFEYDVLPLGQVLEDEPASKRARRGGGTAQSPLRLGCAYRGVSHHARTSRHEAHIWKDGKQLYLGGFYQEECAALAYDLAAIKLRGAEAVTNFPLDQYAAELEAAPQVPLEALVAHLRQQAKCLARIDATAASQEACSMAGWELALSEAVWGHTCLGVYASEAEAARAVDAALIRRDGLAAVPCLAFPLVDYLPLLDSTQIEEAMRLGLLPLAVSAGFHPADTPLPVRGLSIAVPPCQPAGSTASPGASLAGKDVASMLPPVPTPVGRKASITPRCVQPVSTPFSP